MQNQILKSFNVTSSNCEIKVQEGKPYISFDIYDISLNFKLDFEMFSKPEWIKDKGVGEISLSNFNLSVHLIPSSNKGKL